MAMFTVMVIAGQAISGDPLAKFENQNGIIEKISGDINPADLGFHK